MKRGDVVTVATAGDFGKPRPAVIVTQNALLEDGHQAVVVCQLTSTINELADFRVTVDPTPENGLRVRSDIMADKPATVVRHKIGAVIGCLSQQDILRLNVALTYALGLQG